MGGSRQLLIHALAGASLAGASGFVRRKIPSIIRAPRYSDSGAWAVCEVVSEGEGESESALLPPDMLAPWLRMCGAAAGNTAAGLTHPAEKCGGLQKSPKMTLTCGDLRAKESDPANWRGSSR